MATYAVMGEAAWDGREIGILVLDERIPRVPGSVGHAGSFAYPVRYKKIFGATVERLVGLHDAGMEEMFVAAARELRDEGVSAIVGCCGFMALFQRAVSAAVDVPVMLSSVMQLPMIEAMLPYGSKIGVVTANAASLTRELLRCAGVDIAPERLCVCGLENEPEARGALLEEKGTVDDELLRAEVLRAAKKMTDARGGVAAILLECSELPPYARDVQRATGLPVFDFTTMIDWLHASLAQRSYAGI